MDRFRLERWLPGLLVLSAFGLAGCGESDASKPTPTAGTAANGAARKPDAQYVFLAVSKGDTASLRAALAAGADPNARDESGQTLLISAVIRDRADLVKVLLEGGADPAIRDSRGFDARVHAAGRGLLALAEALKCPPEQMELARLIDACKTGDASQLPAAGKTPDLNAALPGDDLALHAAARGGHAPVVKALLALGARKDGTNSQGGTALMAAAAAGKTDAIKVLLEAGSPVNKVDSAGRSALFHAALAGKAEAAQALLKAGADASQKSNDGRLPLVIAVEGGHHEIIDVLRWARPKDKDYLAHGLFAAIDKGGHDVVEHMLDVGADPMARDSTGRPAFLRALAQCSADTLQHFVEKGADPNFLDEQGRTPLMLAATNEKATQHQVAKIISLLASSGADLEARDRETGRTPLLWMAAADEPAAIDQLLKGGARADAVDARGRTALMVAAEAGAENAVGALLLGGADVKARDAEGRTALELAKLGGKPAIVDLLERAGKQ